MWINIYGLLHGRERPRPPAGMRMKPSLRVSLIVLIALFGIAAGYFFSGRVQQGGGEVVPQSADARGSAPRPAFSLPDVDGKAHRIGEWDGKVVLVNFWATWCPPCRREIPAFVRLQEKYGKQGFTVVGVALDTAQNVRDFVDPMGVNYPVLVGEDKGIDIAKEYGNRLGVLPYSVLLNPQGQIVFIQRGELTYEKAEEAIKPLLSHG